MRLSVREKSLVFVCFLALILQGVCGRHNTNARKSLPAMVKYSAQISTAISCVYSVYSVTLSMEIRVTHSLCILVVQQLNIIDSLMNKLCAFILP